MQCLCAPLRNGYRLICSAKMVFNSAKPTYAAIGKDTNENGKALVYQGFFARSHKHLQENDQIFFVNQINKQQLAGAHA